MKLNGKNEEAITMKWRRGIAFLVMLDARASMTIDLNSWPTKNRRIAKRLNRFSCECAAYHRSIACEREREGGRPR